MQPFYRAFVVRQYKPRIMRVLVFISFFFFSLHVWSGTNAPNNESKFEFSKAIYKVKATIRRSDGDFVIVPDESKKEKFIPSYLPEEYKKNGLEVTFDGELGKADKSGTALNIHKIWVSGELKEKLKLIHKSYDLNWPHNPKLMPQSAQNYRGDVWEARGITNRDLK